MRAYPDVGVYEEGASVVVRHPSGVEEGVLSGQAEPVTFLAYLVGDPHLGDLRVGVTHTEEHEPDTRFRPAQAVHGSDN